jgi:CPA1 family monovalent cation:H+ antiporter
MSSYTILTILICLSAFFAYVNHRFIRMPFVIGLFFLSTILSLVILSSKLWLPIPYSQLKAIVEQADISKYILDIMLGFLLFAGSLHTSWSDIRQQWRQVTLLAVGGVLVSTVIIGSLFYGVTVLLHMEIDIIYCFLFGALISPTDPIAVIGILTKANVPKKIETVIVAESLFNDGVGVVTFVALLEIARAGGGSFSVSHFGMLFCQEAVGGILFGLALGLILHYIMRSIDHYDTEVLLTIAFVMAGYSAANALHVSGALAMVIMGLMVGNYKTDDVMSDVSHEYITKFWELLDVILNAVLFILIAFVLVVIEFHTRYVIAGAVAVVIVLLSRVVIVYAPKLITPRLIPYDHAEVRLIVWGGLRGGLSIAMALSLPESEARHPVLIATYFCVLFSILVQGLTVERFAKAATKPTA